MAIKLKDVLNNPFPFFLNDERKNILLSVGVSIFLVAFITTFRPPAEEQIYKTLLISAFTFLVLFTATVVLPKVMPATFDSVSWTVGKHILFTGAVLAVIGLVLATVFYFLGYYPQLGFTGALAHIYRDVLLDAIIPVTIVTLLMKNNLLKQNLADAVGANYELGKIHSMKQLDQHAQSGLTTIHSDTSETLRLNLSDLLFVEAADNYATFFWKNGSFIEKKMLRINLTDAERQLNNSFTLRCHRSFIVNIYMIEAITGNTNGYKLSITGSNYAIPVSRSRGKQIIDKIGQIRSLMELR